MARIGEFTLTGPNEGKTIRILDQYPFTDGVMRVSEADAKLMEPVLCRFYSATVQYFNTTPDSVKETDDTSLSKMATKAGTPTTPIAADTQKATQSTQPAAQIRAEAAKAK